MRVAGNPGAGKVATLTASTNLPGATAKPSAGSVALTANGTSRVTVPIAIPASAGPGTFDVRLTAAITGGQVRSSVARLTVRDRQRPVLSKLRVKPKRFRPASKARPKRGTTVSFSLNETASVRLVVERCSKRAGKKRKRCVRFKATKGAFTRQGAPGANAFRFNGRVRGKALKRGPYRLAATPTDAAGNGGATVRARFDVRR